MAQLRHGIEEASDSFMHAPFGLSDIARLVELRSCNWVVAITGWMSNCPGDNNCPTGGSRFSKITSSRIPREEDQVGPCEQLDALSPFKPFERNVAKGRKIRGPTPSSPPHRNYQITSRMPSTFRDHRLIICLVQ
ncbi:hypothetical protein AMTR_s00028p00129770 [Amborella trichopoda]|uniref:Uncharacterized protein n=1 Tax=Amborella trichopoda TaxID=13333 RepID=W1PKP9_AMBTC|nr:hypothetical protein AMTR_s00028p00129770 [Amborella trichopoda]